MWPRFRLPLCRAGTFGLLVAVSALSCRDLPEIRQRVCGNGVIDPGEDCDVFAPEGQRCGRPGTPVACRFECSQARGSGAPACPSGWQCGADDICRLATGSFVPMSVPIEAAVERVLLGDFQGTGRSAVLGLGGASSVGAAYARVFFLDDDGTPLESSLLGFPVGSPLLRDLSGDGRDDFLFSVVGGVGVLLGQPTQDLVPVAYPLVTLQAGASTRAISIRPHPRSLLDEQLAFFVSYDGADLLTVFEDREHVVAELPYPHDRLAGDPAVADVIKPPSGPCGEVVLGYRDAPEVWFIQPCNPDGSWTTPGTSLRLAATLPEGRTIGTGAFLTDLDGDSEIDLVVGAHPTGTFVAFGCGDGQFCTDKLDSNTAGRLLPVQSSLGPTCSEESIKVDQTPIAVGDVNGDGRPDVVTRSNILVLHDLEIGTDTVRVEVCPAAAKLVGEWSTAKLFDMNLDGRADVVAASSTGLDIEYYAGTGFDRLNLTRITTPAPVSHLSIGDYDGDQIPDLAVGLMGAQEGLGGARRDVLAIAYGRVQQAPEPLVSVASFDRIDQVVAAHFDHTDAVEELGVIALSDDGTQTVTVFLSHGGRRLLAPFGLSGSPAGPVVEEEVIGSPLSLTAGDFDGDGNLDIGSFAIANSPCDVQSCRFRLWVTRSGGQARLLESVFSPLLEDDVLSFVSHESLGVEVAAFPRAVDVDGDGLDELILLVPSRSDPGQAVAWLAQLDRTQSALTMGSVEAVSKGPIQLSADSHPVVSDFDADGHPDAIMIANGSSGRQLLVAWGDAGIDLSTPEAIEIPEEPVAFSFLHTGTGEMLDVAVVGRNGAYVAKRSPSSPRVWSVTVLDGVAGGTSIAVRDIDGDGLDDIAVADAAGVRLYRGKAALP